jgi:hypothetical protein
MKFQGPIYACVAITALSVVAWLATGMQGATHYECKVTRCETNAHCYTKGQEPSDDGPVCKDGQCSDPFEDGKSEPAPVRWEGCFEFGLTPNKYLVDGVLPIAGSFMGLAGLLFFLGRREERSA